MSSSRVCSCVKNSNLNIFLMEHRRRIVVGSSFVHIQSFFRSLIINSGCETLRLPAEKRRNNCRNSVISEEESSNICPSISEISCTFWLRDRTHHARSFEMEIDSLFSPFWGGFFLLFRRKLKEKT